jgi:hypothetical protein
MSMSKPMLILSLILFAGVMFGVNQLAHWGVNNFGAWQFTIIALPLMFLAGYLFDQKWGGGG